MARTVAEMTPAELRGMIEDVVEETLSHYLDPDAELELRPEFAEKLAQEIERADRGERGTDLETIARDLGID